MDARVTGGPVRIDPDKPVRVTRVHPPKPIDIPEPHWKVGDNMDDEGERYVIGNIAVVQCDDGAFEVRYYDETGKLRGDQRMQLVEKP